MDNNNAGVQPVENAPETQMISQDMPPIEATNPEPEVSQANDSPVVEELKTLVGDLTEAYKKKVDDYENVKKWNLKAEKRLKEYGIEEVDEPVAPTLDEESIARIVREQVKAVISEVAPKEDILERANKKISELTNALSNKPNSPTATSVGNRDSIASKYQSSSYWSPEQMKDLERRGLNPDQVYKNIPKQGQSSQI
jgi:hypothetical protein